MKWGIVALLVVSSGTARAEPNAYVQADGIGIPLIAMIVGFDGGYRVEGPLFVHVGARAVVVNIEASSGLATQGSAGIEAHGCVFHGALCAIAGVDVGALHSRSTNRDGITPDEDYSTPIIDLRGVLDMGSAHDRFRIGLDLDVGLASQGTRTFAALPLPLLGYAYQW